MRTLLFLFWVGCLSAQVDTVITNPVYTSYYSFKLKAPIMVKYSLKDGGGNCSREGDSFKAESFTAHNADYNHSGYDKGHLVPAEDFAFDCEKEELTFRYYNCFPQTPALNRGPWKVLESNMRLLSQKDELIILCGGFYNQKTLGGGVAIPDTCWKIIYDLKTKSFLFGYLFTNTPHPIETHLMMNELNTLLEKRYGITISKP